MNKLLKLFILQFVSAVGIYLLLFLLSNCLPMIGWFAIIAVAVFFLLRKESGNYCLWWLEKAKKKMRSILLRKPVR